MKLVDLYGYKPRKKKKLKENKNRPSLVNLLFEDEALTKQVKAVGAKPITLVVLYGPPAAGKGAAKKAIGNFIGANDEQNFKDYLKGLEDKGASQFQEEDEAMTSVTSKVLPPAVFNEIEARVDKGESFDDIIGEYFHVNEKGVKFELSSILSKSAFEKIKDGGGSAEFAKFPNTKAFFTQARGFSKTIDGLSDDINKMLGPGDGNPTLGLRAGAAARYLADIKKEMKAMMSGVKEVGSTAYASVYLADQAGESTANTDRIAQLGKLKGDEEFAGLKIIGIYIHQPADRTRIANLHRASTGGRRVAQSEVDRIFAASPEIDEDGNITKKGPAIEAMESAGFDQIHLYYPPNPFDPEGVEVDGQKIGNAICEPLGTGKGHLDIEGCEEEGEGPKTGARSLKGMEKYAAKSANLDPEKVEDAGGGLPKNLTDEEKEKVIAALEKMKFAGVTTSDLERYLSNIHPPQVRDGGEHGKVPWAKDLFLTKGRDPTEKVTIKDESARTRKTEDEMIVERWNKLAGLLND